MKKHDATSTWSAFLTLALALIAGRAASLLAAGRTAWVLMTSYWVMIAVRDALDAAGRWRE